MQLFVRLTSTCNASNAEEKRMALDYGGKIYAQSDAAPIGEAYALALAANGKWDDAVKTQQAAMFVLVRNGHRSELPAYRDFLQQFQSHKLPDRPWPSTSEVLRAGTSIAGRQTRRRRSKHRRGKSPACGDRSADVVTLRWPMSRR